MKSICRVSLGLNGTLALALGLGFSIAATWCTAADSDGIDFFENKIRPILVQHCYSCHSEDASKVGGGLRLDTKEAFLKGGIDGVVVVSGNPDASLLIKAVRFEEYEMPPPDDGGKRLSESEIALLAQWVKIGAPYPETPLGKRRDINRPWSLRPIIESEPPRPTDLSWCANSVDSFVLAKIESQGLKPSPKADRLTLIRRVTYDLTGLPPTTGEIDAFIADSSPNAFESVVDRLLASPHYGEHWARHWLDVVRYADTAGDTADYPIPEAWRYRNYVIESINSDKPYDEFVKEQIAGDIMAGRSPPDRYAELVTATGFLALSRRFGFDSEKYHHLTIQDTIDTLGQSILGLTVGCARCHDHKFDPVSMQDYYGLYGIFASTRYSFPGSEQKGRYRALVPIVPVHESKAQWRKFQDEYDSLGITPGAVLRSLDDIDGDFEMQHVASGGSEGVLVPPWFYRGNVSVVGDAQSPFKHAYSVGTVGTRIAISDETSAVWQSFHPVLADGKVFLNLEFRISHSGTDNGKRLRMAIGESGQVPVVEAFLDSDSLEFITGPSRFTIPFPKPGDWNCLQLSIDLNAHLFTGTIGVPGNTTIIAPITIPAECSNRVNSIVMESVASPNESRGIIDLDNIAILSEPIATVSTETRHGAEQSQQLLALNVELHDLVGIDGDLETQTNGTSPSENWHPGPNSSVMISASSQSPFTNVYPAGSLGIHLPATSESAYNGFGNRLPKQWNSNTDRLYVSFDFRCRESGDVENGNWRFHLGHTATTAAVQLGFHSKNFFRRSGDTNEVVATLQPGQWHQVQLALDLKTKTFTGTVATKSQRSVFSGDFATGWDGNIDYLFIDSIGHLAGPKPVLDSDNFAISEEPFPPLEAPEVHFAGDPRPSRLAMIKDLRQRIASINAEREARRISLDKKLSTGPVPLAYAVTEGTPHAARLQIRGEPEKPGAEVPRGFIHVLGDAELPPTMNGSGRLELAQWLTRKDNPLVSRVMVNRIWQYHFGRGLVKTPNDFGSRSEPPTHPELLDHLATQFVRSGWSLKSMHRLIVLSSTWQQSSNTKNSDNSFLAADLYAAFPRRRLAAEEIRDSILSVSGELDDVPASEHPFPPSQTWSFSQHVPFTAVYEHDKRSVYLMVQRIKRHPFLSLFDGADPNSSTAERRITTVPTQALYFINDPFVHTKSHQFAEHLLAACSDEGKQIELASRMTLGRLPTDEEQIDASHFLSTYRAELGPSGSHSVALAAYIRSLFGSNEFLHCD